MQYRILLLIHVSGLVTTLYKVRAKNNSISASGWMKAYLSYNGCSITLIKQIWIGKPGFTIIGDYDLPTGLMGV